MHVGILSAFGSVLSLQAPPHRATPHLHAATSVSGGYSASYDAAGNMQCRVPSSATTCAGTATGQALTWDVEGRLSNWQNTTTNPTVTAKYFYDGEGQRVIQQALPLPRIPV
jgi:hypothetical protein